MSRGAEIHVDAKDIKKTIRMLNKLGVSPQKAVTKAAGKAGTVLKRAIKSEVPVKSGALKRGIIRVGERNKGKKGKKVFQVVMDRKYNDVFQKPIRNPGILGGKSPKAYYPSSMEYGFLKRVPGKGGYRLVRMKGSNQYKEKLKLVYKLPSKKVEGHHFMEKGTVKTESQRREMIIDETMKELGKIWENAK